MANGVQIGGGRARGISKVIGAVCMVVIVVLLASVISVMSLEFSERLADVESIEVYDDERCAGDQVLVFEGDFDRFHDQLTDNPCALWLEGGTLVTDGSDRVQQWTDQGPHRSHATQADPDDRPTLYPAGTGPGGIDAPVVGFENEASLRSGCSPGDAEWTAGCSGGGNSGIRHYDEGQSLRIDRDLTGLGIDESTGMAVAAVVYVERFDRGGTWTIGEAGASGREFSMRTRGDDETWPWNAPVPPANHWRAQHWDVADVDFEVDSHREWIVLIHAYDGERTTIRAGGSEVAVEETELDLSNSRDVQVGRWERTDGDPSFYFHGAIAELLVFDRAMSEDELTDLEAYFESRYDVVSG